MKRIIIESSKYEIHYKTEKIWDYKIYRKSDNTYIGNDIKYNAVNDIVFWVIDNLEAGIKLNGFHLAN